MTIEEKLKNPNSYFYFKDSKEGNRKKIKKFLKIIFLLNPKSLKRRQKINNELEIQSNMILIYFQTEKNMIVMAIYF